MKEGFLDRFLRQMRLRQIKPHLSEFANPRVLDVGCGWEAKLLREIEPFIAQGIGIDFKAPDIQTAKLRTFSYFFEKKGEIKGALHDDFEDSALLDSANGGGICIKVCINACINAHIKAS
ncbi:hypothetical protein [Helicobacter sp. 23-1045]